MNCIETSNLSHKFSENETVLDTINLCVPHGSIYGFLGPNGAGKTTTLRLILGLLKKQQGVIRIFDKSFEENRIEILQNTGSLIESPSFYSHLTATENLALLQKIYQCPKERIKKVLEIVGLSQTGKKKAGKFSLGMKQRLSIAIALLHSPKLLILDEPTNGLDPNGILEIRELLKKINAENKVTIVISSHLLAEIERLVTHVGIINKGKILFQGTLQELHQKQVLGAFITIETSDNEKAMKLISSGEITATVQSGQLVIPHIEKEAVAKLNKKLVENNIEVYSITAVKNDLESIFMDLTKN
ncbi:MAG: ABC transporter ATP-binding protein [Bacteroidota bacterium]|nr:ABC transporter ATP-binding protein [Bacteroidota bacterium]